MRRGKNEEEKLEWGGEDGQRNRWKVRMGEDIDIIEEKLETRDDE